MFYGRNQLQCASWTLFRTICDEIDGIKFHHHLSLVDELGKHTQLHYLAAWLRAIGPLQVALIKRFEIRAFKDSRFRVDTHEEAISDVLIKCEGLLGVVLPPSTRLEAYEWSRGPKTIEITLPLLRHHVERQIEKARVRSESGNY